MILVERKKLLTLSEVKWIEAPRYIELSVKNLYESFKGDERMMLYFPDRLPKGRLPDRAYFFNVLNTVHHDYTQELVRVASNHRHQADSVKNDRELVHVSNEWWAKLNEAPFTKRKFFIIANSLRT